MDLILFGMQGSGKGTQGQELIKEFGLANFEMGAELRAAVASGSELGNKVKGIIEAGDLVDDDTIMAIVDEKLHSVPKDQAILFDGIPRTKVQAEKLLEVLNANGRDAFGVFINVSEEECITRMLGRGRQDDTEETIRRRLDNYVVNTVPVIDGFKERDRLIEIDGEQTIEQVTAEMIEKVGYLFA